MFEWFARGETAADVERGAVPEPWWRWTTFATASRGAPPRHLGRTRGLRRRRAGARAQSSGSAGPVPPACSRCLALAGHVSRRQLESARRQGVHAFDSRLCVAAGGRRPPPRHGEARAHARSCRPSCPGSGQERGPGGRRPATLGHAGRAGRLQAHAALRRDRGLAAAAGRRRAGAAPGLAWAAAPRAATSGWWWPRASAPARRRRSRANGKPTLLAQAGIHAGEIDGKDAGLMLLRDMTVRGHEAARCSTAPTCSSSPSSTSTATSGSPPSRGSTSAARPRPGWRTTARNLNLNRDYAKLDAPETRAMVRVLDRWEPGPLPGPARHRRGRLPVRHHLRPQRRARLVAGHRRTGSSASFTPAVTPDLTARGHVPGPLVCRADDADLQQGLAAVDRPAPRLLHRLRRRAPPALRAGGEPLAEALPRSACSARTCSWRARCACWRAQGAALRAGGRRRTAARRAPEVPAGLEAAGGGAAAARELPRHRGDASSLAVSGGKRVVWTGRPVARAGARWCARTRRRRAAARPRGLLGARGVGRRDRAAGGARHPAGAARGAARGRGRGLSAGGARLGPRPSRGASA